MSETQGSGIWPQSFCLPPLSLAVGQTIEWQVGKGPPPQSKSLWLGEEVGSQH